MNYHSCMIGLTILGKTNISLTNYDPIVIKLLIISLLKFPETNGFCPCTRMCFIIFPGHGKQSFYCSGLPSTSTTWRRGSLTHLWLVLAFWRVFDKHKHKEILGIMSHPHPNHHPYITHSALQLHVGFANLPSGNLTYSYWTWLSRHFVSFPNFPWKKVDLSIIM